MTTTTHATPHPDDDATTDLVRAEAPAAATAQTDSTPTPATPVPPAKRSLSTGAIVGIALGGVALVALLFGGGVAVGVALPIGGAGASGNSSQTGFPGGENRGPGEQGTRPEAPRGDTNRSAPTAPNTDQTETQDDSDSE